jgi:hypothetical protein
MYLLLKWDRKKGKIKVRKLIHGKIYPKAKMMGITVLGHPFWQQP